MRAALVPGLCLALCCALPLAAQRTPILIDTDLGDAIDDAFAVALALRSPEVEVRAITTVIDDVEAKTRLAQRMLRIFNRRDIPIAMGAPDALLNPARGSGSREYEALSPSDVLPEAARKPAAQLIIDTLKRGRSTLVAIGPLTNIALALKLDPSIKTTIDKIVLMGGAYASSKVEYNIQRDPVAAAIVFQSGVPIVALGLDVTEPLQMRPHDLDRLSIASDPAGLLLLQLLELAGGSASPTLYDPLTIAWLSKPSLVSLAAGAVSVDLATGRTSFAPAANGNVQVGVKVDATAVLDLVMSRLAAR